MLSTKLTILSKVYADVIPIMIINSLDNIEQDITSYGEIILKVSEVLNELNSDMTLEQVSKQLSVNSRKIGKALRSIGYSFDRSTKKWVYNDASEDSLDLPIFDLIKRSEVQSQPAPIQEHMVMLPKWINEQFEQFAKKIPLDKNALFQLALIEFIENHTNQQRL